MTFAKDKAHLVIFFFGFLFLTSGCSSTCTFFNGHTCEPDLATLCLGTVGISREAATTCLKNHKEELRPACKEALFPSNHSG